MSVGGLILKGACLIRSSNSRSPWDNNTRSFFKKLIREAIKNINCEPIKTTEEIINQVKKINPRLEYKITLNAYIKNRHFGGKIVEALGKVLT